MVRTRDDDGDPAELRDSRPLPAVRRRPAVLHGTLLPARRRRPRHLRLLRRGDVRQGLRHGTRRSEHLPRRRMEPTRLLHRHRRVCITLPLLCGVAACWLGR